MNERPMPVTGWTARLQDWLADQRLSRAQAAKAGRRAEPAHGPTSKTEALTGSPHQGPQGLSGRSDLLGAAGNAGLVG